ncbi:MAG: nickel pincer cofactor biosynthesis protein LarC [Nitrospiria bacterium]
MMKKIAYFDCFSGISGDMILGALVDAGLPISFLNQTVLSLIPRGIKLRARKVKRGHLKGTKVDVLISGPAYPRLRNLASVLHLIEKGRLSPSIKTKSRAIFQRLAEGEGKSHGVKPESVSFEELGGADTVVDIVGAVAGLERLEIDEIHASAINVGEGFIQIHHGKFPVPGPVTVHLLKNIPIYSNGIKKELTTPTGAAILSTLSSSFGSIPLFKLQKTGLGAGDFMIEEAPNLLRLLIGERENQFNQDQVYQIETHIDDLNPQIYETLIEHLLQEGALDATLTPIIMKKGRPAILLTILSPPEALLKIAEKVFRETTSLGFRIQKLNRLMLKREEKKIKTSWGWVRVKRSFLGKEIRTIPEYEDCKRIAEKYRKPLKEMMKQIDMEIFLESTRKTGK